MAYDNYYYSLRLDQQGTVIFRNTTGTPQRDNQRSAYVRFQENSTNNRPEDFQSNRQRLLEYNAMEANSPNGTDSSLQDPRWNTAFASKFFFSSRIRPNIVKSRIGKIKK